MISKAQLRLERKTEEFINYQDRYEARLFYLFLITIEIYAIEN